MKSDLVTVTPETSTLEVLRMMCRSDTDCVLVVEGGHPVGILTAHDLLNVSRRLLEERLANPGRADGGGE